MACLIRIAAWAVVTGWGRLTGQPPVGNACRGLPREETFYDEVIRCLVIDVWAGVQPSSLRVLADETS